MKRFISFVLVLVMCFGIVMPLDAFAAEGEYSHDHTDTTVSDDSYSSDYEENSHSSDVVQPDTGNQSTPSEQVTPPAVDIPPVETLSPVQPTTGPSTPSQTSQPSIPSDILPPVVTEEPQQDSPWIDDQWPSYDDTLWQDDLITDHEHNDETESETPALDPARFISPEDNISDDLRERIIRIQTEIDKFPTREQAILDGTYEDFHNIFMGILAELDLYPEIRLYIQLYDLVDFTYSAYTPMIIATVYKQSTTKNIYYLTRAFSKLTWTSRRNGKQLMMDYCAAINGHAVQYNGTWHVAYCCHPGGLAGDSYEWSGSSTVWANYLTTSQQDMVGQVAYFGYPNCQYLKNHHHDNTKCRAATQALIWDIVIGGISDSGSNKWYGTDPLGKLFGSALGDARTQYNEILNVAANWKEHPTCLYIYPDDAWSNVNEMELDQESGNYTCTVNVGDAYWRTVTNDQTLLLKEYGWPKIDGITFTFNPDPTERKKETITITATKEALESLATSQDVPDVFPEEVSSGWNEDHTQFILKVDSYDPRSKSKGADMGWIYSAYGMNSSVWYQPMFEPIAYVADPVPLYFAFSVPDPTATPAPSATPSIPFEPPTSYPDNETYSITVKKEGEFLTGAPRNGDGTVSQFQYTKKGIEGTVFEIITASSIYYKEIIRWSDDDGPHEREEKHLLYGPGHSMGTVTTNSQGVATMSGLYEGSYTIKEVSVPRGWLLDTSTNTKTVSVGGNATVTFENKRQKVEVEVLKIDSVTSVPLQGAKFGLYADCDIEDAEGNVLVSADECIEYLTSGFDGKVKSTLDLPTDFDFYMIEEQAPNKYQRTSDTFYFSTTFNQSKGETLKYSYTFRNDRTTGSLTLTKIDVELYNRSDYNPLMPNVAQGDATLAGARYGLYARNTIYHPDGQTCSPGHAKGVMYNPGEQVTTVVTDSDGCAYVDDLYLGDYYWKELSPSEGYNTGTDAEPYPSHINDCKEYDVTIPYEGDLVEPVYRSTDVFELVKRQPFQVVKVSDDDEETDAPLLERAGFTIYLKSDLTPLPEGGYDWDSATPVYTYGVDEGGNIIYKDKDVHGSQPSDLKIPAIGKDGLPLGTPKTEIFTDERGYFCTIPLPYGTYVVRETTVPKNHSPIKPFEVVVSEELRETVQTWRVLLDEMWSAKLKIVKKDSETGETVLRPNAEFKIFDIDHNKYVEQVVTYPTPNTLRTFKTDEKGFLVTPLILDPGHYRIEEVAAPEYYTRNPATVEVTIAEDEVYKVDPTLGENVIEVAFEDTSVRGALKVIKKGEIVDSFDERFGFQYVETVLEGAEYNVYAAEDIYSADNQLDRLGNRKIEFREGTLVGTLVTDEHGETAILDHLPLGQYRVVETKAPGGYVLADEDQTVQYVYIDDTEENATILKTIEFTNDRQKVLVKAIKKNNETNEPVLLAHFAIFAAENIYKAPYYVKDKSGYPILFHKDDPVCYAFSDLDGIAAFDYDLPLGKYYIKEIDAPKGFVSTENDHISGNERIDFEASYRGQDIASYELEFEFRNNPTKVSITKTDLATGVEIAGAHMQIIDDEGEVVEDWVSSANVPYIVECLEVGKTYTLREERAPYGYLQAEEIQFTVQDTDDIQPLEMKDDVPTGEIIIDKEGEFLDKVTPMTSVKGWIQHLFEYLLGKMPDVTFEVYAAADIKAADGVSPNYFNNGDLVATITTDSRGVAVLNEVTINGIKQGLPLGYYCIIEKETEDGFKLDGMPRYVNLKYVDQYKATIANEDYWVNDRQRVEISVFKTQTDKPDVLVQGALFELSCEEDILNKNGEVVIPANTAIEQGETNENGHLTFIADLPWGYTYVVKEIKPADGFASNHTPQKFTFDVDAEASEVTLYEMRFMDDSTKVTVSKQDLTTGVEIEGAHLQVIDSEGNIVDEWVSSADEPHFIEYLKINETYTLREERAPYGYLQAEEIQFTVQDTGEIQQVVMKDDVPTGEIIIDKEGEFLEKVTAVTTVKGWIQHLFDYLLGKMPDVTFEVYAAADIVAADGVSPNYFNNGDLVATITTDSSGVAVLNEVTINGVKQGLPLGYYCIIEKETEDGFKLDGMPRYVNLKYVDQYKATIANEDYWVNDRQRVEISVFKTQTDKPDVLVQGALFELSCEEDILNKNGEVVIPANTAIEQGETNENGHLTFIADLPWGYTYVVKEIKPADGFASNHTPQKFTFDVDAEADEVTFYEMHFEDESTKVTVSKQDLTTGVEIEGAHLQVIDSEGNIVDEWVSSADEPHFIEYLKINETYTLREETAPYGYLQAEEIQFTVQDTGEIQPVVMKDDVPTGRIIITKEGEFLEKVTAMTTVKGWIQHLFSYLLGNMPNVTFDVYAAADIKVADGVSKNYYNEGDLVASITTDKSGVAVLDTVTIDGVTQGLPLGKYKIQEKLTNDGYKLDGEPRFVELLYRDQNTSLITTDGGWENIRQKVEVSVVKTEKDKPNVFVSGARFALTAEQDILDKNDKVLIPAGQVIEELETDENGHLTFVADLPWGYTYVIEETAPGPGYATNHAPQKFTFDVDTAADEVTFYEFAIEDEITKVSVSKKDATNGEELPGAKLEIRDKNGEVVDSWTSTDQPHYVEGLVVGETYTLTETRPADGYATAESVEFTIQDTGEIQPVEMFDEDTKFEISKKDATTGEELPGAHLQILDKDGNVIEDWTSSEEPYYVNKLVVGETYTLHEDLAPLGYATASDVEFTVSDTGEIQPVEMKDEITKVSLSKKDATTGDELPGAHLQVTDKDGNIVDEWVSGDEPHIIEGLHVGETYTMTETKPADGFATAESVEFTIQDTGEIQPVEMFDDITEVHVSKQNVAGEEIPGAHLQVKDKDGKVVDEWTSTEDEHIIQGLVVGETYTLTETKPADGYVTAESIEFTIEDTGEIQYVEMVDEWSQVEVSKQNVTGAELAGAKLRILDKKGKTIEEWTTTSKPHIVKGLTVGEEYTLREDFAPLGYAISKDVKFTVKDTTEVQKVKMVDQLIPSGTPKTFDKGSLGLLIALGGILSCGAAAASIGLARRKRKNGK